MNTQTTNGELVKYSNLSPIEETFIRFTNLKVDWNRMGISEQENNQISISLTNGSKWKLLDNCIYVQNSNYCKGDELVEWTLENTPNHSIEEIYENIFGNEYGETLFYEYFGLFVESCKIDLISKSDFSILMLEKKIL